MKSWLFVGVIDILHGYGMEEKRTHKGIKHDRDKVCVQRPNFYASNKRF